MQAYKIATAMAQPGKFSPQIVGYEGEESKENERGDHNGVDETLVNGNTATGTSSSPPKVNKYFFGTLLHLNFTKSNVLAHLVWNTS